MEIYITTKIAAVDPRAIFYIRSRSVWTPLSFIFLFFNFIFFLNFTILYWFCHISKWIRHRHTCVPHPELSSLLPPMESKQCLKAEYQDHHQFSSVQSLSRVWLFVTPCLLLHHQLPEFTQTHVHWVGDAIICCYEQKKKWHRLIISLQPVGHKVK